MSESAASRAIAETSLRAATAAWPDVVSDPHAFAAHVAACSTAGGAAEAHLSDLYLAWAASRGDAAALRHFEDAILGQIDGTVRRVDPSPAFADEVRQELRTRLLLARDGPARIAEYQGRGSLLAWVRVAALRAAFNLKRSQRPALSADDLMGELVGRESDPETRHLKNLYRAEFARALRESLAALPERSRAILRLHFADGLRLAQIGELYGVHESTASRWIKGAVETTAADARRRLLARLRLSPATLDSIARMVESNLDVSIRTLLASDG